MRETSGRQEKESQKTFGRVQAGGFFVGGATNPWALGLQLVKVPTFAVCGKEQLKQGKTLRIQQAVQWGFNQTAYWQDQGWAFVLDFIH